MPLAISFGVHAVLVLAFVVFVTTRASEPAARSGFRHVTFVESRLAEAAPFEPYELPPREPVDEVELTPFDEPGEDATEDDASLPAPVPEITHEAPPLDVQDVPLTAVRPRPRAGEPPAATPAPPPPVVPSQPARKDVRPATKLVLLSRPDLMRFYPEAARRRGIEGSALVEIVVSPAGRVTETRLVRSSGSPLLDRQALRVMQAYRFLPGEGGRARVPVDFRLR